MSQTLRYLRDVLAAEFEVEASLIVPEAHLFDDLDIDSIDAIDILARLRDFTGKALPAESLKSVRTVGDVLALVDGH
jgi:acyl carrier protein